MRPVYTDLYALFRRDPGAEEYFNQLPAYVQDQLSARCRAVDSLERLHAAPFLDISIIDISII